MYVIVVGSGRIGSDLVNRLSRRPNMQVVVVDSNPQAFNNLSHDYPGRIVEGDAMSQDVLVRAGIDRADAIAIVTSSDAMNVVIGHISRTIYHVPVVVARNYDPVLRPLFEAFGLQVVSSTSWGAQRIEEVIHHSDLRAVFSAGNGEVEVYEFVVPDNWHGHPLNELLAGSNCIPVSITRAGRAVLPSENTILEAGDIVHVGATMKGIECMREALHANKE